MRYGFLIDQNRCIGCHACTVACKEEHNMALGVNRTWVKYIEKGRLSRHTAPFRRAALQSLRRRSVYRDLPDGRAFSPA